MVSKRFWDVLAWIAFFIVVLYFFLKIIGVLNSPISADVLALLSAAYFVGRYAQKIDTFLQDVENIKQPEDFRKTLAKVY
ncbi:MAG TPA: hypothetical protein VJI46_03200 [Candidatus Nanoarchaeia archaeon]|nr:hypothetical protein [Candidatus Nanoarchaeia archaeon]